MFPRTSRLADLTGRHDDDALDASVGDGVHDAALVLGALGAPLAGLGARLGAQPAVGVGPITDRQLRRRRQDRQRRRAASASCAGPVRIRGDGDRRRGELLERFADRPADLVAGPGNRRLLVAERRETIGQPEEPLPEPREDGGPGGLDRLGRQKLAAPAAGLHLGEVGLGADQPRPLGAVIGGAGLGRAHLLAQIGDVAAHRADEVVLAALGLRDDARLGSAAGCAARSDRAAWRSRAIGCAFVAMRSPQPAKSNEMIHLSDLMSLRDRRPYVSPRRGFHQERGSGR